MKVRVQNLLGHALDVAGGPALAPGEIAEDVELTPEVKNAIELGLLAKLDDDAPKKGKES